MDKERKVGCYRPGSIAVVVSVELMFQKEGLEVGPGPSHSIVYTQTHKTDMQAGGHDEGGARAMDK